MGPPDDSYDLALAASTLRSNSSDVHALLKALCGELSDTLGERLHVERGGRLRRSDAIASVRVTLGPDAFDAVIEGSSLRCSVAHTSGGIRIRSETVDTEEWLVRLLGALKAEAAHSESAGQALENIVIGGHP
jgi:hypothetical protein